MIRSAADRRFGGLWKDTQCVGVDEKGAVVDRVPSFMVLGGSIGGVMTAIMVIGGVLLQTPSVFELSAIPGIFIYVVLAAPIGILIGIPPSFLTGVSYALFPAVRRWGRIALIGALASALEGGILADLLNFSGQATTLETRLSFAGVLATAGAVAAVACHLRFRTARAQASSL